MFGSGIYALKAGEVKKYKVGFHFYDFPKGILQVSYFIFLKKSMLASLSSDGSKKCYTQMA